MPNIKQRKPLVAVTVEMPWPNIESDYWSKKTNSIEILTLDSPIEQVVAIYQYSKERWMYFAQYKRMIPKRYIINIEEIDPSKVDDDIVFFIHSKPVEIRNKLKRIVEKKKQLWYPVKSIDHLKQIAKENKDYWLVGVVL